MDEEVIRNNRLSLSPFYFYLYLHLHRSLGWWRAETEEIFRYFWMKKTLIWKTRSVLSFIRRNPRIALNHFIFAFMKLGDTLLIVACCYERAKVVELLLSRGACPNIPADVTKMILNYRCNINSCGCASICCLRTFTRTEILHLCAPFLRMTQQLWKSYSNMAPT